MSQDKIEKKLKAALRWKKVTGSDTNKNVKTDSLDGQLPGFPGHLLSQAREAKGLSQQEVARELHLTSRVINGLENDDFSHVNSPIFARGYIRSYARHLGLDGDSLVAEYDAVYGGPDHGKKPISTVRKVSEQARPGDAWVKLGSVVLLLALVGASWWWWQSQRESADPVAVNEVAVQDSQGEDILAKLPEDDDLDLQLDQVSSNSDSVGFTDETAQAELAVATEEPTTSEEPAAEASANVAVEEQAQDQTPVEAADATDAASATQPEEMATPAVEEYSMADDTAAISLLPGQGLLLIEFADDCWVEIQDGDGNMVLTDLMTNGQTIEMAVQAPVQLLLGRASAVTNLQFAQRSVDLKPFTRKDIARVDLEL
ncbi:MAG: RodZ domain-containing protein [Pseudomonadales bacterium]